MMRISANASAPTTASAMTAITIHSVVWRIPTPLRNWEKKRPISMPEPAPIAMYAPHSAQPARNPARGPRVTPTRAYTDPELEM